MARFRVHHPSMMRQMRKLRPPKQSAAASAFVAIILAVMLFAWYLTLESSIIFPATDGGSQMTSLDQANTIKKLETDGWTVAVTEGGAIGGGRVLGAAVQMVKIIDGVAHHILVLPDGKTEEMK
jgi:hypothetical protein